MPPVVCFFDEHMRSNTNHYRGSTSLPVKLLASDRQTATLDPQPGPGQQTEESVTRLTTP
jgi:hypothetical protein